MDAKVVVGHVQADGCGVMGELLGETVGQPGEPPLSHAEREILEKTPASAQL